nr:PREDICTED: protein regulator of cytokinesis 1 isoform X3 [Latimeria chalumnae]|eukprot:XP_014340378.1 PREDICTED: protein regulator of cytokinesis 1 isoform X3 [Latimeria chalumnae]
MRKSVVLAAESVECLKDALAQLKTIWEDIGIPEDQRLQRTEVVKTHIKGLLDMMIAEEQSLKSRLLKSIELCRKELDTLCTELHLPPFQEEEEEGSTILQLEKDLRTRAEVMLKQKKERMQELKTLKERDRDLCDLLCATPYHIDSDAVPALEQLDAFRRHLAALTAEKEYRRGEFVSTKRQIILCMEELDYTPDTSFERDVVCEDEAAFCLSTDNIAALKQLLHQLEVQKSQKEAMCSLLRNKITELWERLQVPQEERDAFRVHMRGTKPQTIQALEAEVTRLEELKLQNIKNVIAAIREELTAYWDKCFHSEEQRQAFTPYFDDENTEEILRLHDEELGRLKMHYELHRELFEGVQKWQESWKLYLEFERKATDPNRFTNRGGNLLKEEKQRAKLHKSLPKLEEELKLRIEGWEQEQGREFLVNGQRFMSYVAERWVLYQQEKEKEKQERQMKKCRQIEEEMLYGSTPKTPTKRRVLGSHTPGKTRKFGQPVWTPNRTLLKPPRLGKSERNKENISHLNGTTLSGACMSAATPQRNFSINSVASTYSEFAKDSVYTDSTASQISENFQSLPNLRSLLEF